LGDPLKTREAALMEQLKTQDAQSKYGTHAPDWRLLGRSARRRPAVMAPGCTLRQAE
jgi:hypothetical protein